MHKEALETYGKIYRMNVLAGMKFVMIIDPDEIRKAFQHDGKFPKRRMLDMVKVYRNQNKNLYSSAGILIENGEKWYNTRVKVQQPMLKPQIVDKYIGKMHSVSEDFVARMKYLRDQNGEVPNYLNELYKWALESIGLITFNTRLGCLEANLTENSEPQRMITAVSNVFQVAAATELGPKFWLWYPKLTKNYKKLEKNSECIYDITTKYMEETKEKLKDKTANNAVDVGILETILQQDIDNREVVGFMCDLLAAGIDTTSHSTAAILYLLAKHQDRQEILHREIKTVLENNNYKITREVLDAMPYLKGCIQESMRLMPVVDGTQRYYDQDIVLSGYRIPAGTYVALLSGVAGKLADYFEQPDQFMPERWLPGAKKPHPYAHMPFGSGPRSCIGRRLAYQEMQLLLIKVLQNFKIEYHHDDIGMIFRFVNMPDKPLRFKFVDRK
uniref:Cytochrome P450 n=1 Tax=Strigamia maritima TaxID=126957 RepID=T1JKS5_STRMM